MTKDQLAVILSENSGFRNKISRILVNWLALGDDQAVFDDEMCLECFVDHQHKILKRRVWPVTKFEIADYIIRLDQYFEKGFPLKGTREKTVNLIIKEVSYFVSQKIVKEKFLEIPGTVNIKIIVTARTLFGSVKDYYNEEDMGLAF